MKLKVKLDPSAYMPERAYEYDAGYDLRAPRSVEEGRGYATWIGSHRSVIVDTGVHIAIPEGHVGFLKSKSGLNIKHGITSEGVIDSGYTGSIRVKLYNLSDRDYAIHDGDKITQLVLLPIITPDLEQVDELDQTERGDGGFGSTGR